VVISAALAACASTTPSERERALARLPSQAQLVAAADGTALAAFRPVIDAARAFLPRNLDCVVDAALTSEVVAVAVTPGTGATIVILTRAHVARCAALSRIGDDLFVATIGAGTIADTQAASALADSRWSRARSYLVNDPIAIAIERAGQRMLAVAQPKPIAGWLTIDATDPPAAERMLRTWIDRQQTTALHGFAGNLVVQGRGSQVLVRTTNLSAEELALAVADVLRLADAPAPPPVAKFACPALTGGIVRCTGTEIVVDSLTTTLRKLVAHDTEPVVAGSDIVGIRLTEDAELLLRRGDVIMGLDGQRITSTEQLHELARYAHERAALAVRRDGADVILELSE